MGYFAKLGCAEQPADKSAAPTPHEPEPTPAAVQPADVTAAEQPNTETASTVLALEPETSPATDDSAARQAHEAAEAKRRAEWEAKQQARREAEQDELDSIAAMSDKDVTAASVQRVEADIERLTGRSMKQSVAAFIQEVSRSEPAFARLTLNPRKSMLHCIQYINRQALDYLKNELDAEGIKSSSVYGGDVPDDLCYKWAEDYFRDPDAKEDREPEDKLVPRPYIGTASHVKFQKPTKAELKQKAQEETGQLALDVFGKAGRLC